MRRLFVIAFALLFGTNFLYADEPIVKDRQYENKLSKNSPSIYKLTAKTEVVYKIQTAVGYVTTIELPDEALKVFLGDQDLFVVEVYGSEVIIKPATNYTDAKSNLVIYTDQTRLSFDISVGVPETADFVLDFRYPGDEAIVDNAFKRKLKEKKEELESAYQEILKKEDENIKSLTQSRFEEALKTGAKIKPLKVSKTKDKIELKLLSLSEIGERYYLRFSIKNSLDRDYFMERLLLGKETFKRSGFGMKKERFVPVEFTENIDKAIPKNTLKYGLIGFDKVTLNKDEKFVIRLYEKDQMDPLEIEQVPLEV